MKLSSSFKHCTKVVFSLEYYNNTISLYMCGLSYIGYPNLSGVEEEDDEMNGEIISKDLWSVFGGVGGG